MKYNCKIRIGAASPSAHEMTELFLYSRKVNRETGLYPILQNRFYNVLMHRCQTQGPRAESGPTYNFIRPERQFFIDVIFSILTARRYLTLKAHTLQLP